MSGSSLLISLTNKNYSDSHMNICLFVFFFLRNKYTQGRGKEILTQKHTTTLLKSHNNFLEKLEQIIVHTTHLLKHVS